MTMIVTKTSPALPKDYTYEVGSGRIPGSDPGFLACTSRKVMQGSCSTIWDYGGNYTYLTADTQLYISSTSANDIGNLIVVQGMDDNYDRVTAIGVTNGQNQVALSIPLFRVFVAVVGNAVALEGEVYVAEADTLTNGEPDTPSSVKALIPLSMDLLGNVISTGTDLASDHITHSGLYTVPAGYTMNILDIYSGTAKNDDVRIGARIRLLGGPWLNRNPAFVYQTTIRVVFDGILQLPEKTDFEVRAIAGNDNSFVQFHATFVLEKNL